MAEISREQQLIASLQQSAAVIQKLKTQIGAYTEPIAIIGMGCRFPGGSDSPAHFWQLLAQGIDGVTAIPADRRSAQADSTGAPTCYGGFLSNIDTFDPRFFGIAPREATMMDPQQRLLLEVAWEALEDAALVPESLFKSRTGVFVGACTFDYAILTHRQPLAAPQDELYRMTGLPGAAAGRIAYTFGFTGPAAVIDTACSASLVALHQACQSLRHQECHLALAGGVNLILNDEWARAAVGLDEAMHAADGRCKTFDSAANGFGRGEGCGLVVLKRLADAQRDGDPIRAIIRGSMINQDGRSSGFSAPSGPSQQLVIRQALQNAGVQPDQVGYIEAHGTGTKLGDPIEIGALNAVFGGRTAPLWVGSVKTNFGHLEGAAGIAGLIKTVLMLEHGQIPPHLHFHTPNPYIDWTGSPVQIPVNLTAWPQDAGPRLAGVSAFGISGTNAHLVLAAGGVGQRQGAEAPAPGKHPYHLFTLSAQSPAALHAYVQRYQTFLANEPALDLGDLCYTSQLGRSHFAHRLRIVASSTAALAAALADWLATGPPTAPPPVPTAPVSIAFLFTGQGAQYVNMGRELYESAPLFRRTLARCDELFQTYLGASILALLYPPVGQSPAALGQAADLDDTTYTQPALFALEVALATLWRAWGIQPAFLLGHSIGELAAACVAGVFSLEDGVKLVAARARLMGALPPGGAMIALLTDEARVQAALAAYLAGAPATPIALAAVNGPAHVVISGPRAAVETIAAQLAAEGVKTRPLTVSHAFHSPLMAPMLAAFRQVAATITYQQPTLPLISNLTGKVAGAEIATPDYWVRHVRDAVRFADGVATLHDQQVTCFLEIGPKPVLLGMAEPVISGRAQDGAAAACFLPTLRAGRSDWQQLLESLGTLYQQGVTVDWPSFHHESPRRKIGLPTYPFQRQRYWVTPEEQTVAHHAISPTQVTGQHSAILAHLQAGTLAQLQPQLETTGELTAAERAALPRLLALLQQQHQTEVTTQSIQDWFYHVTWQPRDHATALLPDRSSLAAGEPRHNAWLIFADQQGLGEAVATALRAQGSTVFLVYAGSHFHQLAADCFEIAADDGASYTRLLTQLQALAPLETVLFLWGTDAPSATALAGDECSLLALTAQLCGRTLYLVQALIKAQCEVAGLWLVTCNAQAVQPTDAVAGVVQATLWGLGRVIGLEHPELSCARLDLETLTPANLAAQVQWLLAERHQRQPGVGAAAPGGASHEDEVAWRAGKRYVARLAHWTALPAKPLVISAAATYLITGGLGGLGLLVARWLVEQGARQLLLVSRRAPTPSIQAQLAELQALGAQLIIVQADVADRAQLAHALGQIDARYPLKGVIHAAGLVDDGALYQQTSSRFATVLAPKVAGAWHLHALTEHCDLDFFVLFSSLAGLLGNQGQANYAAGNAFLAALAHYRTARQLPALSIDWGAWAAVGLAARLPRPSQTGHTHPAPSLISPAQGMAALTLLLRQGLAQVGVMPLVSAAFWQTATAERPFFADLRPLLSPPAVTAEEPARRAVPTIRQQLAAAPGPDHQRILVAYLGGLVAKVLGYANTALIDPTQKVIALGMDSLMAVELRNQIRRELGYNLEFAQILEGISIHELAEAIATAYPSAVADDQPHHTSSEQAAALHDYGQCQAAMSASESREGEEEWVTIKI